MKVKGSKNSNQDIVHRIFEANFVGICKSFIKGRLIDIGCGVKPYKSMLESFVEEHIGVDHIDTLHDKSNIDIFGTAYSIPVEEGTFDSAICTAVLEHLEEPEMAIRECYRILKPGGYAVYSVPFIYPLHEEPRDFFRYSKYGLQYLFEKTGFEIIEIRSLSGFIVTFIKLHLLIIAKYNNGIIKFLKLYTIYNFICLNIGIFLNKYDKTKSYTWMYIVVARKC